MTGENSYPHLAHEQPRDTTIEALRSENAMLRADLATMAVVKSQLVAAVARLDAENTQLRDGEFTERERKLLWHATYNAARTNPRATPTAYVTPTPRTGRWKRGSHDRNQAQMH